MSADQIPAFAFSAANVSPGTSDTVEFDGFKVRATIYADDDAQAPWERYDGHGEVSDWTRRAKAPGELVLAQDGDAKRFYDFKAACEIARRDGWGVSPYDIATEEGANGLKRVTGQWFEGRDLLTFRSDWTDDVNVATREVYDAHRATMSPRAYAALAARADFERLKAWCDDKWSYVGVAVTVSRDGVILNDQYEHALWGIESDSPDYLAETANELAPAALEAARQWLRDMAPPVQDARALLTRCADFLAGFEDDATQPSAAALLADVRAMFGEAPPKAKDEPPRDQPEWPMAAAAGLLEARGHDANAALHTAITRLQGQGATTLQPESPTDWRTLSHGQAGRLLRAIITGDENGGKF